jgi:hypothetical protein
LKELYIVVIFVRQTAPCHPNGIKIFSYSLFAWSLILRPALTEKEREETITLKVKAKMSNPQIVVATEKDLSTVKRTLKKYKGKKTLKNLPGQGRKRKLTPELRKKVLRKAKRKKPAT